MKCLNKWFMKHHRRVGGVVTAPPSGTRFYSYRTVWLCGFSLQSEFLSGGEGYEYEYKEKWRAGKILPTGTQCYQLLPHPLTIKLSTGGKPADGMGLNEVAESALP